MAEQGGVYTLSNPLDLEDLTSQLRSILASVSQRLDVAEGFGGTPLGGLTTMVDAIGSRAFATVYNNPYKTPLLVVISTTGTANGTTRAYSDSGSLPVTYVGGWSSAQNFGRGAVFVVLPGNNYIVTDADGTIYSWKEWH